MARIKRHFSNRNLFMPIGLRTTLIYLFIYKRRLIRNKLPKVHCIICCEYFVDAHFRQSCCYLFVFKWTVVENSDLTRKTTLELLRHGQLLVRIVECV